MAADKTYPAGFQVRQDGNAYVPTGAKVEIETGGKMSLNGVDVAADVAALASIPALITFTPAAGGANVSLVTIQVKNAAGVALAVPCVLDVWLSDAATGLGLTATAASGAVAAGASGTDLVALVAKKLTRVQTDATGKYILSITDAAKTLFFVAAAVPSSGALKVSAQLITGNYG